MSKPTLYLFIGYPGAGKTSLARIIHEKTGAVHLWADHERRNLFAAPTHSQDESVALYTQLNQRADELLAAGQSVIFDTNFNFYDDREHLRQIAAKHGADCLVIWLTTPLGLAKQRAVHSAETRNGYTTAMSENQFDDIVCKLEAPRDDEKIIKIDGTKLDPEAVLAQLGL